MPLSRRGPPRKGGLTGRCREWLRVLAGAKGLLPVPAACLSTARSAEPSRQVARSRAQVHGYPAGAWLNLVSWSRDSRHVSFTTRSPGARALPAALTLTGALCAGLTACSM